MKRTFVLFGILTVFLLSCIGLGAKVKKRTVYNLNKTSWELSQISKKGQKLPIPEGANITVNFSDGKTAATLMAGPEELMKIELNFFDILQNSPRINYNSTTLSLKNKNGEVWTFKKLDLSKKLKNTKWKLIEMGQTSFPEKEGEITISFAENKINGNSGINNYFGNCEIKNDSIKIGPVGSTKMAGPENLMKIESEYLKLLQNSKTIKLVKNILTLTTNDGKTLKFEKVD